MAFKEAMKSKIAVYGRSSKTSNEAFRHLACIHQWRIHGSLLFERSRVLHELFFVLVFDLILIVIIFVFVANPRAGDINDPTRAII